MIDRSTVDRILEASRIEEVVGDYVNLKKRGVNLLGNCPFHNEKTPSFTVSPAKGIYKCFGCGKAGNSVNFIMEHDHISFPEALRHLAKKYNIEIEEEENDEKYKIEKNERESLFIVSAYAQTYFTQTLWENEEGKAIGLAYFLERGFTEATIKKFSLGYSLSKSGSFTKTALAAGYQLEFLQKTGLTIVNEDRQADRFWGRVMFPIHNVTGRVIGFGARVLKTDIKAAKYLNSPESEIYHKSQVLYGLFFAKKAIIAEDNCYLVEGYTDVISLHQSGIENVVASSGTSLTTDQIRLISRYTKNITVLYDGDAAGIKASLRGIDMILEEGLNVKVLLFPEGEDPDSFGRKTSASELKAYLKSNTKDFILFKTDLLKGEAGSDPIKKAELIREVVNSIAKIPDAFIRSTYSRECSVLLDIDEHIVISELNKIRRQQIKKQSGEQTEHSPEPEISVESFTKDLPAKDADNIDFQERDIIRLLLIHGNKDLIFIDNSDPREPVEHTVSVKDYILSEFQTDREFLQFENELYGRVFKVFEDAGDASLSENYFLNHEDAVITKLAADLMSSPYELSENWEKHEIHVSTEIQLLKQAVFTSIYSLKMRKLMKVIRGLKEDLKTISGDEELTEALNHLQALEAVKKELAKQLGIVIIK